MTPPEHPSNPGTLTRYGFTWGPMEVSRVASFGRSVLREEVRLQRVLGVQTDYAELDIYCSPTGRSLRVFNRRRQAELVEEGRGRKVRALLDLILASEVGTDDGEWAAIKHLATEIDRGSA